MTMASPEYLAQLAAAMGPQGAMIPDAQRNADVLDRLEQTDAPMAPLTVGQALGVGRSGGSVIAPPQPAPKVVGTRRIHDVWGDREVPITDAGVINNPFSGHTSTPFDATSRNPVSFENTAGKLTPEDEANLKEQQAKESGVTYASSKPSDATPAAESKPLVLPPSGGGGGGMPKEYAEAFRLRGEAIEDKALGDRIANANDVATHSQAAEMLQQYQREHEARQKAFEDEAKAQEQAIAEQSKMTASMKIDPDRMWKNASTGRQVAFILASALGGFVGGYTGSGRNVGLEQLNRTIDQDIAAQQQEIESAKGRVGDMKGALADFYKRTDNMEQAKALAFAKSLEAAKEQSEALAAGSRDPYVLAALKENRAALSMEIGKWHQQAAAAQASGGVDRKKLADLTADFMLKGNVDAQTAQKLALGAMGYGNMPEGVSTTGASKDAVVNLPEGGTATAINKDAADDYRQRMLGAAKFERAITELQNIRKEAGGGTMSPAARARAEGLAAEAKTAYVQMNGFKRTPNETEFHALDMIVPPNAAQYSMSTDAVLQQARTLAEEAKQDAAGTYLVNPKRSKATAASAESFKPLK